MSVYGVDVAVALKRPPRIDEWRRVVVEAPDGHAAELLACQIVACGRGVVMPVASVVTDWPAES